MSGPPSPAVRFVLDLGLALQRYGVAAHRLEDAMTGVAERLGLRAQFFSTPTAFFATFEHEDGPPHTELLRAESGEIDLAKLARLDRLATDVAEGRVSTQQGRQVIREVLASKRRADRTLTLLGFTVVSGAAAPFFGGGLAESLTAATIGLASGGLAVLLGRTTVGTRAYELIAAFVATVIAQAAARATQNVAPDIATLAGLIVLVPGLTLTTALSEVATRNLVSGASRLTAAALVFLQITFGVALGRRLDVQLFDGPPPIVHVTPLPSWMLPLALGLAAVSLVVLFRASRPLAPAVIAAAIVSFLGARFGTQLLGSELGGAVGALLVGVAANAYARAANRPAVVMLVPGLILLVPGSLGFRSLGLMLREDAVAGIAMGFSTLLAAISIVAGLLMANLLVSPRRAL